MPSPKSTVLYRGAWPTHVDVERGEKVIIDGAVFMVNRDRVRIYSYQHALDLVYSGDLFSEPATPAPPAFNVWWDITGRHETQGAKPYYVAMAAWSAALAWAARNA